MVHPMRRAGRFRLVALAALTAVAGWHPATAWWRALP